MKYVTDLPIEIRRDWAIELKSGRWIQTDAVLRRIKKNGEPCPPEHCCMGVLCEMAYARGIVVKNTGGEQGWYITYGERPASNYPPQEVWAWVESPDNDPFYVNPSDVPEIESYEPLGVNLFKLNDLYHYTFDQIADVIYPEGKDG